MFYAFNDIECLYNDLVLLLSNVSKVLMYIWLSSLMVMTNYSQPTFMWTVASSLTAFA